MSEFVWVCESVRVGVGVCGFNSGLRWGEGSSLCDEYVISFDFSLHIVRIDNLILSWLNSVP